MKKIIVRILYKILDKLTEPDVKKYQPLKPKPLRERQPLPLEYSRAGGNIRVWKYLQSRRVHVDAKVTMMEAYIVLDDHGWMSVSDACNKLKVPASNVHPILGQMAKMGFIERHKTRPITYAQRSFYVYRRLSEVVSPTLDAAGL
jgi:hypothetical protein